MLLSTVGWFLCTFIVMVLAIAYLAETAGEAAAKYRGRYSAAYRAGQEARRQHGDYVECPFLPGTERHLSWWEGWHRG